VNPFKPEDLDKEPDFTVLKVEVPELGLLFHVAEMTADEAEDRLWNPWHEYKTAIKQEGNKRFRAFAATSALCDETRKFLYAPDKIEAVAAKLAGKSTKAVERLFMAADGLNAFSPGSVEVIEKNS